MRYIRLTAIVASIGAVGGFLGGIVIAAIFLGLGVATGDVSLAVLGRNAGMTLAVPAVAGAVGAAAGAVLGPIYVWTILRAVPLWRAIGETAFAAAIVVGVALVTIPSGFTIIGGALLASFAAAVRLNYAHRPQARLAAGGGAS